MSTNPVSGGGSPWQDWARMRAARTAGQDGGSAGQSGIGAAASKLASDLGSFATQLTGAASQPTATTSTGTGATAASTDATTDTPGSTSPAAALSTDLQSFLTQLRSAGGSQGTPGVHHRGHHHGANADSPPTASTAPGNASPASTDTGSGDQLLAPTATAEFVDRIARAFRSYASQMSAANPSATDASATPGTSISA